MPLTYVRVINEQLINRSILIDKIDKSQGNSEGYAQKAKQKIYVPFVNPVDPLVKGYLNLVPTDEVLLSANNGTISGLVTAGYISALAVPSTAIATPIITNAVWAAGVTTLTGTGFISVNPDVTRVIFTDPLGNSEVISSGSFTLPFTSTNIAIADAVFSVLTPPTTGWSVRVLANSKLSASSIV